MIFDYIYDYLTVILSSNTDVFFSNSFFFLITFVASMTYIYENNSYQIIRGKHTFFAFAVLLFILVIYNPLFQYAFSKIPTVNDNVLSRFWIICPIWLIIACSLSKCFFNYRKHFFTNIFAVLMALCILCSGNPVITSGMLSNTCNSYKIRSESIEIADTILALNDYEPTSLLVFSPDRKTWEKYEVGGTVYEGIKQYTGLIDIAGYGYTESQWNDCMLSEMTPNGWLSSYDYTRIILNEYFENHKSYQYILMPDDDKIIAKMDYCGFELVAHIDSYYLFENKIS